MESPQVNKLRIVSVPSFEKNFDSIGSGIASVASIATSTVFEVQINPEQLHRTFKIKYNEEVVQGEQEKRKFKSVEPETIELKFILDGTGIVPAVLGADITSDIMGAIGADIGFVETKLVQLKQVVYDFIDETHRTPFLIVNWGTFVFHGVMEELSYNYMLFHPSGIPLRAEVTLKIKSHETSSKALNAALSFLSPDLTRRHLTKSSDSILTICNEVYKDEKYYLEVAKANKIVNFRALKAETTLQLPSIDV
jgi:nucleoid-associated protein YgaU